ncbi:peroxiredoxin [Parvularcula dongshanensis]|uniref:Glutathione-dependent peroxiredoxin n=1 Tax=Parvularcula dongshanensis TaxID=1173995 RepID=A0A840I380_9PROT|nr:peroxiredoxin [Parvularcula dongshanensis]MBB4658500.1 peroxiredoxin [Parvularcula dongshanensis]
MIQPGERLPDLQLMRATPDGPEAVSTSELFAGKRSVLFAVPGAFTPTCSARHLPGFVEKKDALAEKGIDQLVCTSVNDAFVMQAWAEASGAEGIVMLADGNAALAEALDLVLDGTGFGMGKRSRRYAMVVNDGVVERLDVEEGGAFEVSSAEHLLAQL